MVASGKVTQADYTTQKFVQAVSSGEDPYPYIGNMLQPATEYACYMVKVVCDRLRELGARACMTGSGTAVFGLFDGYVQALEVFRQFDLDVRQNIFVWHKTGHRNNQEKSYNWRH